MRVLDFHCAACGGSFEAFLRSDSDEPQCPQCGSARTMRQPVLQMAAHTRRTRRGRVIDLSSNACPCAAAKGSRH